MFKEIPMETLTKEEVLNLQEGQKVTYHLVNPDRYFGDKPTPGVVQYVRQVSKEEFNVMIVVRGCNVIARISDYDSKWYLTN